MVVNNNEEMMVAPKIKNNKITSCLLNGILVTGTYANPLIMTNTIERNVKAGIKVEGLARAIIENRNLIQKNLS